MATLSSVLCIDVVDDKELSENMLEPESLAHGIVNLNSKFFLDADEKIATNVLTLLNRLSNLIRQLNGQLILSLMVSKRLKIAVIHQPTFLH